MKKYEIKEIKGPSNSTKLVHWNGVDGQDTLCGMDLSGCWGEWNEAKRTSHKVDCEDCLNVVKHVKKIVLREMKLA